MELKYIIKYSFFINLIAFNLVRASKLRTIDSSKRMDSGEHIRPTAAHSQHK